MTTTGAPTTPYSTYLGDRDPIAAIADTTACIRALASPWPAPEYERTYAPGKWTARQILVHLAQSEIALGTRVRMALTVPNYAAQPFEQDRWLDLERTIAGPDALNAFLTLAAMNRSFFNSLPSAARQTTMTHPEYGSISVDWVIHLIAGHQINHLLQLEEIGGSR